MVFYSKQVMVVLSQPLSGFVLTLGFVEPFCTGCGKNCFPGHEVVAVTMVSGIACASGARQLFCHGKNFLAVKVVVERPSAASGTGCGEVIFQANKSPRVPMIQNPIGIISAIYAPQISL